MIAQLSTSWSDRQPTFSRKRLFIVGWVICALAGSPVAAVWAQGSNWEQPSAIEQRVELLSPIDQQFMAQQRADIEQRANRLGRRLTGAPERDIETLQRLLDEGLVSSEDTLGLQAMGVVLGDLLATELGMEWIVYRDRAGRSRALRYPRTDTYLFPITMISRRWGVGSNKPVAVIFNDVVRETRPLLPGSRWR